jgi:hypothetical protein
MHLLSVRASARRFSVIKTHLLRSLLIQERAALYTR